VNRRDTANAAPGREIAVRTPPKERLVTPIVGVDFTENAKPLAQATALIEVARFRLHVALSDVHRALERGDVAEAKHVARAALEAERDRG
jgi:hypothetical protein